MQRLPFLPVWSLLLLGAALAAGPVLGQGTGSAEFKQQPPIGTYIGTNNPCSPINPCAVVTPALNSASLPTPTMAAESDVPATTGPATTGNAPAAPAAGAPQAAANPNCPPAGARGGRQGGRGQFAGRGGQAGAEGFRRFAQVSPRNGGAEGGRGFGGGLGGGTGGRGGQFAQNGGQPNGQGRGFGQGRGQGGFARGGNGCPRPAGAAGSPGVQDPGAAAPAAAKPSATAPAAR